MDPNFIEYAKYLGFWAAGMVVAFLFNRPAKPTAQQLLDQHFMLKVKEITNSGGSVEMREQRIAELVSAYIKLSI